MTPSDPSDVGLRANPHYALCRDLGQLARPHVVTLAHAGDERYVRAEMSRGLRLGDIKPVALSVRSDWAQYFSEHDSPANFALRRPAHPADARS